MNWFEISYTLLGGLGIFFFGINTLSQALQASTGNLIRRVINSLTSNRIMAVLVGIFVTTIVQSSSITTVMVVGFVNANLMKLPQAIGVILGANIGTTITGWIIAIKVGKYGLLLVGLGVFPMIFSSHERHKRLGRLVLALGFIFMGLEYMSAAFKPLRTHAPFINMLHYFSADSYTTLYACIFIGTILTFVIQSSSAMLAITIAMAVTGTITFQTAVALVLGENIGTTITALLASIGASTDAKRAARAHAVFNILGVLIISTFFWSYLSIVESFIRGQADFTSPDGSKPYIAAHIAAGHTLFNLINTLVFIPLLGPLSRFVTWITPTGIEKEIPHLIALTGRTNLSPSLALAATEKELGKMGIIVSKALLQSKEYLLSSHKNQKARTKVNKYEEITDSIQAEITVYMSVVQEARLTPEQSRLTDAYIRVADEFESIGDYCASIVRYYDRYEDLKETMSTEAKEMLSHFFDGVISYFASIHNTFQTREDWNMHHFHSRMKQLTNEANLIRDNHMKRIKSGECKPLSALIYSDIIVGLRKINGHTENVADVLSDSKRETA